MTTTAANPNTCEATGSGFPRFFTHTNGFKSDAIFVRFDAYDRLRVITATGERAPNMTAWTLDDTLGQLRKGNAVELTKTQALAMIPNAAGQGTAKPYPAPAGSRKDGP